jgi:cell division protein ZapA (FtsZ GTPase activity inhibitor)
MTKETTVSVVIHGTQLHFKTDDPEYIHELARFVEEQIGKIESSGKVTASSKAVTLAAFNIADELLRLRKEKKGLSERLDVMLEMAKKIPISIRLPEAPD